MNVVDMNGRPVVVDRLARTERTIDPVIVLQLREVDPTKLLGYLGTTLPVDDLEWQALFVLDRAQWLRSAADVLLAEAETVSCRSRAR